MAYEESLRALADPTRRKVFELLVARPRPVADLAEELPVSRPAVSQHLKVLSDAGLVCVQARGTQRIHMVRQDGLAELRTYLDSLWSDVLSAFADSFEEEPKA